MDTYPWWGVCVGPFCWAALVFLTCVFVFGILGAKPQGRSGQTYVDPNNLETQPNYNIIGAAALVAQRSTGRETGDDMHVYVDPTDTRHEVQRHLDYVEKHGADYGVYVHHVSKSAVNRIYKGKGQPG